MDDPALDPGLHRAALRALARVNWISGTAGRIWREVRGHGTARSGPLRILDVACGGGEVLCALARRARRAGLPLELHGCDVSPTALEHARALSAREGVALRLHRLDVLSDPLPEDFDLVTSTLFLHHLERPAAVSLLARLREISRAGVIQDLVRSRLGYTLAWSGLRILSRSRIAWVDGPRSVEAGFTLPEARALAEEAGLPRVSLARVWPERFLLRWGTA